MANIGTVLKDEISRLSRREIRKQVEPVRKASAACRRDIAALKRQVQQLQRAVTALAKRPRLQSEGKSGASTRPLRFVAKGLVSLRARLGLSAAELAQLIGVSGQTIYNWEHKKTTPRKEQLVSLAELRALGKREVRTRLESLQEPKPRKRPK
jgi:DNA-binding XRE family transcriptional regulator